MGQAWVESDRLLLLLDGLDEVATPKLADCVKAINEFRQTRGLVPIVVCCRTHVYTGVHVSVRLNSAIAIRQLTSEQADLYLDQAGDQLAGLHQVIHDDPVLQEIATSPLMLQVMSKAFRQEESSAPLKLTQMSGIAIGWIDFFMSIAMHCFYGLIITAVDIYFFERRLHAFGQPIKISKWDWQRKFALAISVGMVAFMQLWLWGEETTLLILQLLTTVFMFVLFAHVAFGRQYTDDIRTIETLRWSW